MRALLPLSLLLLTLSPGWSQPVRTPRIGFEALLGADDLPLLVDWPAFQDSSYSRQNINQDAGNFLRVEPNGEQVLVDTDGPGVVYRVWSTGVVATQMSDECRLRFYFDGEAEPRLDLSIAEFFGGKGSQWPFVPPLAVTFESGVGNAEGPCNLSYVPIPFAQHLKITGRKIMFYHVNYHKLPAGTQVESFSLKQAQEHRKTLDQAAAQWNGIPARPGKTKGQVSEIANVSLPPGKERTIPIKGAGSILGLELKLAEVSPRILRSLVLEIAFEERKNVCVRVPAGDFFGTGAGEHLFKSLFAGMTERGYYSWWPMPFRKMAAVTLRNESGVPLRVERLKVLHEAGTPAPNAGYFHAQYVHNADVPLREDYQILRVEGRGKLVGCNVTMQNARKGEGIFYLEGDEKIYVDGEKWPSRWLGTGTEDYFNGSYFWNHPDKAGMARPLGGLTFLDWGMGRVCAYRWHFPDFINFTRNLKLDLEHGGVSDSPANYSSVAYYYLDRPTPLGALPSVAERLPRTALGPAPGFLGCAPKGEVTFARNPLRKQTFGALDPEFESEDGAFVGRGKAGDRLQLRFEVPGEENFKPELVLCGGPGFATVRASIDGRVLGDVSAQKPNFTPWLSASLKPIRLEKGDHELALEILAPESGKPSENRKQRRSAGLVALQLHPQSALMDQWSVVGNWPCAKEGGWEKVWAPETNQTLSASYTLPDGREVRWKPVDSGSVGLGGGDWLVAYALTYIWSPDARTIPLFIGKDDGLKVWVNDRPVFDVNTWSHAVPDSFFTTANLQAGWNKVLVKCANWFGGWSFALRPGNPDGQLRFARTPDQ